MTDPARDFFGRGFPIEAHMSDTIIVNRSKATRRVTRKRHVLQMGANEFDEATATEIQADPYFAACCRRGIFRVEAAPAVAPEVVVEPGDTVVNIRTLSVIEALKAVRACADVRQLEAWLDQDGRKTVRDAILRRGIVITDRKDATDSAGAADTSDLDYPVVGGE